MFILTISIAFVMLFSVVSAIYLSL